MPQHKTFKHGTRVKYIGRSVCKAMYGELGTVTKEVPGIRRTSIYVIWERAGLLYHWQSELEVVK